MQRLKNTDQAPGFTAQDINNKTFSLNQPRSQLLLLAFFRYASCPLCHLRMHDLINHHEKLKDRLEIVAVFQSPAAKIRQYVGQQPIPFRVLPDPKRNLYSLYGVEKSWAGFARAWSVNISQVFNAVVKHRFLPCSIEGEVHRIPADFIIDTDNKIVKAYYGKDIGDHLPLAELFSSVGQNATGKQDPTTDITGGQ